MRVQRGSNIDSLLARKLEDDGSRLWDFGEQGREASVDGRRIREYFVARGKPDNYQYSPSEAREAKNYFKAVDRSQIKKARDKQLAMIDAQMMDKGSIGEFEGKEIAEMNAVLADPESSPPISKIGSLLSAEGESPLDQTGREWMDRREVEEEFAAMENPPEDSYGDKFSKFLGDAGDYVTDLFSPEEKTYRDVADTEGENRYLNKLAREKYESGKVHPFADTASYSKIKEDTEGESALDKIGRENMLNDMDDLGPDKTDVESSFWERTKQGRVGDAFSGLFSSDDSGRDEALANEKKDNEALSGKIAAGAKLYSLLKPETPQAAPTIPTARVTRGSVAFPGMQLASQKARRKYFTPKGLMA